MGSHVEVLIMIKDIRSYCCPISRATGDVELNKDNGEALKGPERLKQRIANDPGCDPYGER